MTKDKDFKRLVRARMDKTGESYTTARAHLLAKSPPPLPDDYEKVAGMSDAAALKATGRSWPEWTAILDGARASEWDHRQIVDFVMEQEGDIGGWWAQGVTVAYERFRGLRDFGQRRGGGYDVNKSKTIAVPVATLFDAVEDAEMRRQWVGDIEWTVRTATRPKSMRIRLANDSPLDAYFTAKGDSKSAVSLQHRDIASKEEAEEMKTLWGERLDMLKRLLEAET